MNNPETPAADTDRTKTRVAIIGGHSARASVPRYNSIATMTSIAALFMPPPMVIHPRLSRRAVLVDDDQFNPEAIAAKAEKDSFAAQARYATIVAKRKAKMLRRTIQRCRSTPRAWFDITTAKYEPGQGDNVGPVLLYRGLPGWRASGMLEPHSKVFSGDGDTPEAALAALAQAMEVPTP